MIKVTIILVVILMAFFILALCKISSRAEKRARDIVAKLEESKK